MRPHAVPRYCHHRASGQAVVRLIGIDHYLGPYGSPESHERYERAIAEWRVEKAEKQSAEKCVEGESRFDRTIAEVLYRYREFALAYYQKDGQPSKELQAIKYSLRPVRQLYGSAKSASSARWRSRRCVSTWSLPAGAATWSTPASTESGDS